MRKTNTENIFKVATDKQNVICPPEQIFIKPEFDYLLTIGGDLIDNKIEYDKLIRLLASLGETEFYIRENIGVIDTDRISPFEITISIKDSYQTFQAKVRAFEPPFGWTVYEFFINGKMEYWGIYICEYPTINIIGCDKKISDKFRQVFSIVGNGYEDLKEFIGKEYERRPDYLKKLVENYRLDNKD